MVAAENFLCCARRGLLTASLLVGAVVSTGAQPAATDLLDEPLAARSGPRGATMFATLAPDQTGIVTENSYTDPKMWGERYQEFALGAIGTGVTIGDFDRDGRPDVFCVSKTGISRLFRNLGAWKFEDVTAKAGLGGPASGWKSLLGMGGGGDAVEAWKQGATFADVNNDGWLDLYLCRYAVPNQLFINQGDGTFKEEAAARGLAIVDASGMAAFCDYDRDGWLDVYLQTNMLNASVNPNGQRDYLFHNLGDGTFADVTERAGISGETLAHSATWWDYDADGWPDLYVANDFAGPDALYHNHRDGTFVRTLNQTVPHTPYSSMGADLGDVNNDGRIDYFVADMATTTHEKDQRGMASSRALSRDDVDSATIAPQLPRNALLLATGTGSFQEAAGLASLPATDWTWSPRWEDLDNDGRLDLHVTNGMIREYQNADLRERIILASNLPERMRLMKESPVLAEANLAFRNLGDLQFEKAGAAWGLDQVGVSFGSAFGDLDGDGDLDLVFSNYEAGATVLRNDSDTGHRITITLRGTTSNRFGVGATVRLDSAAGPQVRALVLARGYLSSSEPILHFGLGGDTRIQRLTVSWPSGHTQTFSDLPVDRRFTITEPPGPAPAGAVAGVGDPGPASPRPATVMPQFSDVTTALNLAFVAREGADAEALKQPLMPVRFDRRGPALAVGDLDGDGRDDLVCGGTTNDPAQVLFATAAGLFRTTTFAREGRALLDDGPQLLFDVDGDGAADLLTTRAGIGVAAGGPEYRPTLFLNDGSGQFRAAPAEMLPALSVSAGALAAADFNRDGRLDVFVGARVFPGRYPLPPRSALLAGRGSATPGFDDVTETAGATLRDAGLVTSALWSDVDDDGWPDLLVALEWGPVKCFRNRQGAGFDDWTERLGFAEAGTGWWNSLAAADFNRDGRPDYVAGNLGLNSPYHASAERPALLFLGDFGGGGAPQLIEGFYEGDRLFPRRTRKDLGGAIATVLKRFPGNDAYARATLGEILGEPRLATAKRFVATEFRSGVFLSQPGGGFHFAPLPRIAQIAPLQGVVAGDFDGDGLADIYAVQNFFAPIPTIGRFDGGISQLLHGDGRGGFTVVAPADSGLVVPGDAKALVVLDLDQDGWPDFVASRNNTTALAFRNGGITGRHSVRVMLRGPAGNPAAVGARLTLELADGSTQTSEIHAGSGYYSQSTAACFFGWPDTNPPRQLRVRWPSGATSEHDLPRDAKSVTLSQP